MNIQDRVALHIGQLTLANIQAGAALDERNAILEHAFGALANAARRGDVPDLEALKVESPPFAQWLETQSR